MASPLPFSSRRPVLVGMVHLPALPGAPDHTLSMDHIVRRARDEALVLLDGGFDAVLVENYGDTPFHPGPVPPETVAAMSRAVAAVVEAAGDRPVGVNVLRNDARAALGIAAATGARFIRVNVHAGTMWTDQGTLTGRAWETLRVRGTLAPTCAILADVHVKHATPPPGSTLEDAARDLCSRAGADALILSGTGTGEPTDPDRVRRVGGTVPEAPVFVGSGATPDSVPELLAAGATGFIVGSWIQRGGRAGAGVDPDRVRRFVEAGRSVQFARRDP